MDPETPEVKRHTLFDCFSPNFGATTVSAVAQVLSEGLLPLQIDALGAFLVAVGDTMSYIAVQKELNELMCPKKKTITSGSTETQEGTSQTGASGADGPQSEPDTGELTVIR